VSTDFAALILALAEGRVEFILVGDVAAAVHGATRAIYAVVDVLYSRNPENIARIVSALAPLKPYWRGAVPGLPFRCDADTVSHGLNFTLTTTAGNIDLLGELTYNGTYEKLLPDTIIVAVFGIECRCLSLQATDRREACSRARQRP
jgi:hypothetical protein